LENLAPGTSLSNRFVRHGSKHSLAAIITVGGILFVAGTMANNDPLLAPLWLLGAVAGFTLQRSRFCFASAFRDLFLFGSSRMMRAIIVGLVIATVGFGINMHGQVPFPEFGVQPQEANILPFGPSTVVGGLLFGFGMVLSGGCVSGSLYRMAEGYIGSWVSIAGVLVGMGLLSQSWNWWWSTTIVNEPRIWIPANFGLGYGGGIGITLVGLLALFLIVLWWESRSGLSTVPMGRSERSEDTFEEKLSVFWNLFFVRGWPAAVGGAVLGVIGLMMYMTHMPWGVTGELARWSNGIMTLLQFPPPEALGLSDIGGCAGRSDETGIFTHTFAVTVGVLPGALVGALFSREFKLRFPQSPKRYVQALTGGIIMGYGAALAVGCTVGAFFSSVPSLSLSAWLFALALAFGAFVGVQVIKRLA